MMPSSNHRIVDVTASNVDQVGFFCCMSKKKSPGYQAKLRWLKERFGEGLRLKLLQLPERGFIEYTPGEFAWRPIRADGYMVIHCLWVVGKSKGKGYARVLVEECIRDAKDARMKGVAVVTSEGNWLVGKRLFEDLGFERVDHALPSFNLMVKKLDAAPSPSFAGDWLQKQESCGAGLTVFRSDQCPYIDDAATIVTSTAQKLGVPCRVRELKAREEVLNEAPSAFGVFSTVLDGRLLSYCYQHAEEIEAAVKSRMT